MTHKFNFLMSIVWLLTHAAANAQAPATSETTIEGTPYLDESFAEGEIYANNTHRKVSIRYNILQDLMEYKQGAQALALDPSPTIKKINIGTSTFVVQKFESQGKAKFGFFTLLDSGKVMLFSKKGVKFMEAKKGGALDGSDQPARYTRSPDVFYYKVGDSELREVENIKSMIASLPDKREDLTLYAKKEKITHRKEKTLIQFVRYYNSL